MVPPLPIDDVLPLITQAVERYGVVVVQAPPGAGKTTKVPLSLLDTVQGRILVLEPRRIAARSAAERMAQMLGEVAGETVGYRMRGAQAVGSGTRIEVITEGLLTRMIQSDPELPGVGAILFDEVHERSIHTDLGLALALEVRSALRPDLVLVAMSATLDAAPVASFMENAPIVTSEGRAFPVETRYRDRPRQGGWRTLARDVADMVERALTEEDGNILVFLTGAAEIRAAERALSVPEYVEVAPLYGALPFKAQQAAIRAPQMGQRKVVLSTAIAETSLTIEGIRVVVDAGLARVSRFDPNTGMARLVTEKVSRAAADQRQGRAGRLEPGVCYRLWTRGEHGALPAFSAPEITTTDLAPLALELARWGSVDVPFLTPPPRGMLAEAQSLLRTLGALDRSGGMTAHGKALAAIPAHPRLAHMILSDGAAVDLAALLQGRDVLQRDSSPLPVDLGLRLRALRDPQRFRGESPHAVDPGALAEARAEAKRLKRFAGPTGGLSAGAALALAYPDRIALRRSGDAPRYIMSGGSGAVLPASDALAGQRMLVLADLDGNRTEATVRAALPIAEAEVKALFPERLDDVSTCIWSRRHKRVEARVQVRLGALILEDQAWRDPPENSVAEAATQGVEDLGLASLGWSPAARRFQARALYARHGAVVLPDLSDEALLASLRGWLTPYLGRCRTAADLRALDPIEALQALVPWEATQEMDRLAPEQFRAPTGTRAPITYDTEAGPGIDIRLQEMFGVTVHPTVGAERIPLRITLLSPARRPVQTTSDLPRFWSTSYADVRKDMRGRYPKHPWPEDPRVALPTTRTKPRGK